MSAQETFEPRIDESDSTPSGSSGLWIALGALMAGLAVITGAFAAHGLDAHMVKKYGDQRKVVAGEEVLAAKKYLDDFRTGAQYQMYHALGLVAVGLLIRQRSRLSLSIAAWSFLGGIILFSGSLYVLSITGQTKLGMITPIGGLLFIVGWVAFAIAAVRSRAA